MARRSPPSRILVVDDNTDVAELLRDMLTPLGYSVDLAPTGSSAVERVAEDPPDLVLLDLALPDMTGIAVLQLLRALCPTLRVVVISGTHDEEVARTARERGAVDFLSKPLDFTRLAEVIAVTLARRDS